MSKTRGYKDVPTSAIIPDDERSAALPHVRSEPLLAVNYVWPTVADYEKDMGRPVNEAFRIGWDMARTQMAHVRALSANEKDDRT